VKCEKSLNLLNAQSKIEDIVNQHYPLETVHHTYENQTEDETKYGKPEKMSYCDCIHEMLVSENERIVADLES